MRNTSTSSFVSLVLLLDLRGLLGRMGICGHEDERSSPGALQSNVQLIDGRGPMENNCKKCGAKVVKDRRFCPVCGKRYSGYDDQLIEWDY